MAKLIYGISKLKLWDKKQMPMIARIVLITNYVLAPAILEKYYTNRWEKSDRLYYLNNYDIYIGLSGQPFVYYAFFIST